MVLPSKQQIQNLPTLLDIVQMYHKEIQDHVKTGLWNGIYAGGKDVAWNLPSGEFCNNADEDKFIVVQTQNKRHTLKPNLKYSPFIFRGQNKNYPMILSSFGRDDYDILGNPIDRRIAHAKHLVANLKAEEFIDLLKRHPLFMMLDRGIILAPEKEPIFINMNYYGLAQHYGFKTGVMDFTSDINVAAFFACTKCVGFDKYEPITDTLEYPYGVIYVHEINPMFTFKGIGFSTIGLQLYPRSGLQKGLLYNEVETSCRINKLITKVHYFRHDPMVSLYFHKKFSTKLFPADGISKYAKEILDSTEVPGNVFAHNLYINQDNFENNIAELESQGLSVNWNKQRYFSQELLNGLDSDLKNGLWEEFCKQIYFADEIKGKAMHESLLSLPNNPAYAHYFKIGEYNRIMYCDYLDHRRANIKKNKSTVQRGFWNV